MNPEPPAVLRGWALEALGLQPGMPTDAARQAILRRLAEMDFIPPGGWDSALRLAGIAACDGDFNAMTFAAARRAADDSLRAEIEAFAARYFSLLPNARITEYQELMRKCAGEPAATARLKMLRPALELPCELPAHQPEDVTELLQQVRRLFVLQRQERASRRLALSKQCGADFGRWQSAARIVQAKFARYAELEPVLLRELSASGNREKQRERIARQRERAARRARPPRVVTRGSPTNRWGIGIAAVVFFGILRLVSMTSTSHSQKTVAPVAPHFDVRKANEEMNERVNKALRNGEHIGEAMRRFYGLPPEKAPPSPPNRSPSSRSLEGVTVRVAPSVEEAREIVRQLQEQRQASPGSMQRYEVHAFNINLEQAREMLRQLRGQQAQDGPNNSRDALVSALETAIEEASRSSQKSP